MKWKSMCLFWEVQLVDSSLSLPPGMLRSMPMVFPGLRTLNWTRCWMTGFEWFWCSHFVLWAVLHARQDSLRFFKFQSTTQKKTQEIEISQQYWISANICQCLLLPRALPLRFAAAMVKTGWEQPRPERTSPQTSSAANRSWDLQPGMPLRLSTVKC